MKSRLNKYEIIKELETGSIMQTYLTRIEPIVKVIEAKNKQEFCLICQRLEEIKDQLYKIIEENDKIYIVMDNDPELMKKIDDILLSKIEKELEIDGKKMITKEEIFKLFEMEKSMCKIKSEKKLNNKMMEITGIGFFCQLDDFPIKYCLFTNNHVISNIEIGNTISFTYTEIKKGNENWKRNYNNIRKKSIH